MDGEVQHGSQTLRFEIKSSSAPKITQGFHDAMLGAMETGYQRGRIQDESMQWPIRSMV